VRVNDCEDGLRDGDERQFLVSALDGVLDGVGEKFQLVDEVRKFRRVDLRELQLPLGQMTQDLFRQRRCNGGGTAITKFAISGMTAI